MPSAAGFQEVEVDIPLRDCQLACIVVTYNRAERLRKTLTSTLAQNVDHVVVIDNASTDHTADVLDQFKRRDSRLVVERQKQGRGGSWGFARGMRLADRLLGSKGWLLLLDDDSWPEANCIARFRERIQTYEQRAVTGVAAAVFGCDGRAVESNRPVLNIFRRPLEVLALTAQSSRAVRDMYHVPHRIINESGHILSVDSISFVGLFLNLSNLPSGRGRFPRGGLFIYSDDTTYTLELVRRGKRLILDTDLRFRHETKGGGAAASVLYPSWKHYYIVRNSFLMNKSLSRLWYIPLCLATLVTHATKGVLEMIRQGDPTVLRLVWLASWDGMRNNYSRRHQVIAAMGAQSNRKGFKATEETCA